MRWKLEFPRFFVTIPELVPHLRQVDIPVCPGKIHFLGDWPCQRPDAGGMGLIPIKAVYGTTWDGFYLGYELAADVPASSFGRTHLHEGELMNLRVRYTDDRLEAEARQTVLTDELVEQLRRPENRVPDQFSRVIPGGECLTFSVTLRALMFRPEARGPLLARIDDPQIRNEVVLVLGAVGDEATVPELIARYPRGPLPPGDRPGLLTRVCFSYALCWLTGVPLDRSREGTDCRDGVAERWEAWWAENHETFRVPPVRPRASWVPSYPLLADHHIARIRSMFAQSGYHGWEYE
jgi:hypothetical protein